MLIAMPLLVALAGVLMWALCSNAILKKMGEYAYFCGLLAFLLVGAEPMIKLLSR